VLMCTLFENLRILQEGFGPSFGDHSLRDLTALLAKSCRRSDLVARLGVAQFAILAIDADALTVSLLPNRLAKLVAEHNEARTPWGPIELRTSVGLWSARDERSFAEFLDAVESNLRCTPLHARAGGEITAREAAS
jgi:diguanylate cyclase (GGDEF)-like protein